MSIYKGRRKITTEYKADSKLSNDDVKNILEGALEIHELNHKEIRYLQEYAKGQQTILNKEKEVRPEINNQLVINHAEMVSRTIVGYFLGNPIQYVQNGDTNKQAEIDDLNRYVAYEDKSTVDHEIGQHQSVSGTAYRIIYTDGILADEVPFENKSLDPAYTFVVYENTIAERPVLGVTYMAYQDEKGNQEGLKIFAYSKFGMYIMKQPDKTLYPGADTTIDFVPYAINAVPIVEYPNNMWRIGDWELALSLMDAINALQSGRLDDVDQIVQSLIVFINADIDQDRYAEMREAGVVALKSKEGHQSKVDTINNSLDQSGVAMLSEELEALLYAMLGIPDRKSRSGGGGDTGQAVELRDGWADLEIVARNKELTFKKAERQSLRVMLSIMRNKGVSSLTLLDIDIKFTRNKNNNLLVKAQAYSTLLATKTLTPADCLSIVDLVSDVNEYVSRGEAFWEDQFAGKNEGVTEAPTEEIVVDEPITTPEED